MIIVRVKVIVDLVIIKKLDSNYICKGFIGSFVEFGNIYKVLKNNRVCLYIECCFM